MTAELVDRPPTVGPDLPSSTVSAVPPRNFFNIVFGGPDQELLVPIIYGTPEEGRARLALAEAQISREANNPADLTPATIRISHLHELMSHYFNDGVAIRDFIGMGAVIQTNHPDGPKVSHTGDLFIRFVPRLTSCDSRPNVPYPDPRAVQAMHQRFAVPFRFDEPLRVDLSNRHSFRPSSTVSPLALDDSAASPIPKDEASLKEARDLSDHLMEEAAEEIRAKLRATFDTPTVQTPSTPASDHDESSKDNSSDEDYEESDSDDSSGIDSDSDELESLSSFGETPPIQRTNFIAPLPQLDDEDDIDENVSPDDREGAGLALEPERFGSSFDFEKLEAKKYPFRYFDAPNRPSDQSPSLPPTLSLPSTAESSRSSTPSLVPIVTCDDGKTFIPITISSGGTVTENESVVPSHVVSTSSSTQASSSQEDEKDNVNPFLDISTNSAPQKISRTTEALLKAASTPASESVLFNATVARPLPTVEEIPEGMDVDIPPRKPPTPYWVPVNQRVSVGSNLNPAASTFRPSCPPYGPLPAQPVASAPPVTQTFPVTAHFFTTVTNRLHQAERRTSDLEDQVHDCKEVNDRLQGEIKDDQKRIAELAWLYGRVDAAETQQRLLQAKVSRLSKDRPQQADFRFRKEVTSRAEQTKQEVAKVRSQIDRRVGEFATEIGQLRRTLNDIQVSQAVDKASAIKETMEIRKTVFTEYRDRFTRLEQALQLIYGQIKRQPVPQTQRPAYGNRWGNHAPANRTPHLASDLSLAPLLSAAQPIACH